MGAAAAKGVFPDPSPGEKPFTGGGISATLPTAFFRSLSDFSACCSLPQMRSQSYHGQSASHSPLYSCAHLSWQCDGTAMYMNQAVGKIVSVALSDGEVYPFRRRVRLAGRVVGT